MEGAKIGRADIKKVAIVGPECTGKSELSAFLGEHYKTNWVREYARAYLDNLNRPYEESDLLKIAHGQLRMEDEWASSANELLICDTNLIVIKIWSHYKYGRCDDEIIQMINSRKYDLHLLTYIDLPWEADPQREHPTERARLWQLYKKELDSQNVPYVEIKGERAQRQTTAINAINRITSLTT